MLLAAFHFASLMLSDNVIVVEEPVTEVQVVEQAPVEPEVVVIKTEPQPLIPPTPVVEEIVNEVKPLLSVNMETGPANKKYENIMAQLPPVLPPKMAEEFMFGVLHQPYVKRMRVEEYQQAELAAGDVVAYMWMPMDESNTILQYGMIATAYGLIYVTCTLDASGNILDPFKPLDVYYENTSLRHIVATLAADHARRFPLSGVFSLDAVKNMDDLYFLFGNPHSQEDSYNIAFLL